MEERHPFLDMLVLHGHAVNLILNSNDVSAVIYYVIKPYKTVVAYAKSILNEAWTKMVFCE